MTFQIPFLATFSKVFDRPKDITDIVYKFANLVAILDVILNFSVPSHLL